jgi:hypothetical protein
MTGKQKAVDGGPGVFAVIVLAIGAGCLLVALVSVFNTAYGLGLSLQYSGTSTKLPASWDEVVGLAAVGVLIVGLTLFGGAVKRRYVAAKGRPWLRVGILLGALGLLVLVGRGLQVLALVQTYGSMLAYYATDGDLEDVAAELAKEPDREALDEAVHRAAQYDNEGALALLLAAGADMRDESRPVEQRRCALMGRSFEFTKVAIEHGVTATNCANGATAVYEVVKFGADDAEVARTVALLVGAGWSRTAAPEYARDTPVEVARQKQWTRTLAALE